jgi:2,3-bisphosphoglycerate-independent phosphoglycerate mutase
MEKAILFICDGLGDLPVKGRTPLEAARKKNIDRLAKEGINGMMSTLGEGIIPGSDTGHLQLLGYSPREFYPGRGPLEALGAGIDLEHGDVAFRCNFGSVDAKGKLLDRRAGRISTAEAAEIGKALDGMMVDGVLVIFRPTVEHRASVVFRGRGLCAAISDTDPHGEGEVLACKPKDGSPEARRTAEIVNKFMKIAHEKMSAHHLNLKRMKERKLPANVALLRGTGMFHKIPGLNERFGIAGTCIAGGALYKGVCRYVGMDAQNVKGATGTKDTDLDAKVNAAIAALKTKDFVLLHVKATDNFGHDGDFEGKRKMIEKIDAAVGKLMKWGGAYIVLTGDHSTPVLLKGHSADPVPICIWGKNVRTDDVKKFGERACAHGGLGHILGSDVMPVILGLLLKAKMYGS